MLSITRWFRFDYWLSDVVLGELDFSKEILATFGKFSCPAIPYVMLDEQVWIPPQFPIVTTMLSTSAITIDRASESVNELPLHKGNMVEDFKPHGDLPSFFD